MLKNYQFKIESSENLSQRNRIPFNTAYKIYSYLLEKISSVYAEYLHFDNIKPVHPFLYFDKTSNYHIFNISLLNEEAIENFEPSLNNLNYIELNKGSFNLEYLNSKLITSDELVANSSTQMINKFTLYFKSPTAFKSQEKYVYYPEINLILNSLIAKWNNFNNIKIEDLEAETILKNKIRMDSFHLNSYRFILKGSSIPGFIGEITYKPYYPYPMNKLLSILLNYSQYCGIGIKTTLGMGGVDKYIEYRDSYN